MSGRGKGGKGLGKGGAKRHRKVLRDNIQVRCTRCCTLSTLCAVVCACLHAVVVWSPRALPCQGLQLL